jgi:class 3 adenylate cyclase
VSQLIEPLESARSAAARQSWRTAYEAYSGVETVGLDAGDLERYAEAAWWSGKLDEAIALRERAYASYTAADDALGAARMGLTLAWDYEGRGSIAISNGWLANAERLLEGLPEAPEHGRLLLWQAITALFIEGDIARADELFDETYQLAKRVGDRDIQMLSLSGKGRAAIKAGETEKGLALLDEASASAMGGDLRPHAAGLIYCLTISACHDVGDIRRASEWTEAANRFCDRLDVTGFPGACRIHRAESLRIRGDWPAAEAQATAACQELYDFDRQITAFGYYEIGEIRRRRGDIAGAEEAYRTSNELGRDPQPGLALLRLAEGKTESAVAGLASSLRQIEDPLTRLRRLPAQVEVSLAAGDLTTARAAAEELEQIVDAYKIGDRRTLAFDATLHVARGRIELRERNWAAAKATLRRGRDLWLEIGAPYEAGQARMLLGVALKGEGDEHGAEAELDGALAAFERLGAAPEEARVKELLGRVASRRTFLFTDIVDSTKLLETLGDEKWKRLLARHDDVVRERIAEAGGEIVKKTGDGFFATFDSPKAAVDTAIAIQRALAEEVFAPDVRIGVHSGDAFAAAGDSRDYVGQSVHVAARVGALAGAGEIVVSADSLQGLTTTYRIVQPRSETLKGVEQPVDVVSVAWR